MRVWDEPFTPEQEVAVSNILSSQRESLLDEFMVIFNEIGEKLITNTKI